MADEKKEKIHLICKVVYKGKVVSFKSREVSDELLSMREGNFNMSHQFQKLGEDCVTEILDKFNK